MIPLLLTAHFVSKMKKDKIWVVCLVIGVGFLNVAGKGSGRGVSVLLGFFSLLRYPWASLF